MRQGLAERIGHLQRPDPKEYQQRDSQQVVQRHALAKWQELIQLVQHLPQRHLHTQGQQMLDNT